MTDPTISRALEHVAACTNRYGAAYDERDDAIRNAARHGASVDQIAAAARVTPLWIAAVLYEPADTDRGDMPT